DGGNQRRVLKLDDNLGGGFNGLMADEWGYSFDWRPSAVPAGPSPTAATPGPTPSPIPTTSAAVAGAIPLEIGAEVAFPENAALIIETGCWGCDGPSRGLDRIYQRPDGSWSRETLFEPSRLGLSQYIDSTGAQRGPHIAGFAVAPGLSEIAVGVCIAGSCATDGLDSWAPDSVLAVFRSVDGGVTWTRLGDVADGLLLGGIIAPSQYLVSRAEERNVVTYEAFPGGEPVTPPDGGKWLFAVLSGQPLWYTEGSRVLWADGSTFADFGNDTQAGPASTDGSKTAVLWHRTKFGGEGTDFVSVIVSGSTTTYGLPGLSLAMIPFTGNSLVGNVTYRDGKYAPSIIDLKDGVLHPLGEPFTGADFAVGRNHIVGFQTGPFARVVNTGSCLNIRDGPSTTAAVVTCAADGVLLRDIGEASEADGVTWSRVVTPSGTEGWSAAQYLER
ncbi:MAG TPA: SH3 domain-containing protein, partial [Dehalococcoidia bacterium]|nr:SH3 domain-containing protein [Dehalococcoidia bacterium]